jgi:hypothetical protein
MITLLKLIGEKMFTENPLVSAFLSTSIASFIALFQLAGNKEGFVQGVLWTVVVSLVGLTVRFALKWKDGVDKKIETNQGEVDNVRTNYIDRFRLLESNIKEQINTSSQETLKSINANHNEFLKTIGETNERVAALESKVED